MNSGFTHAHASIGQLERLPLELPRCSINLHVGDARKQSRRIPYPRSGRDLQKDTNDILVSAHKHSDNRYN